MNVASEKLAGDAEIDLRVVARRLWSGRWWISASCVVFTAAFTAASLLMTPIYRATTVAVDASSGRDGMGSLGGALGQLGGLASLAGISVGGSSGQIEESLAVLRSREFTENFIRDRRLLPELFSERWDKKNARWTVPPEEQPTLAQAYRFFDNTVRNVARDKLTGLIKIDIEWKDPVKAATWANELVVRLNANMRARAIASSDASVGYLEKELTGTSVVETRQAINRLIEAQINQRMLASVSQEYALRVVDRALPPDPKNVVRPNKRLLVVLGATLGLMLGAFGVLIASAVSKARRTA